MSNDNAFERLFKLQATVGKLILDGKRDPEVVAVHIQKIIDGLIPVPAGFCNKFELRADLGIVTVPEDYDHSSYLTTFQSRYKEKVDIHGSGLAHPAFLHPQKILEPGEKLWVRAFSYVDVGLHLKEWMHLCASQKAVYPGAQGLALLWSQKRDRLPMGLRYLSPESYMSFNWNGEPDRSGGNCSATDYQIPLLRVDSEGGCEFSLYNFTNEPLLRAYVVLCFNKM